MSDQVLSRSFADLADVEVSGDGRTLVLACVPFDSPALVSDGGPAYREQFRQGAFAHVAKAPNRVELRYNHDQSGAPFGFGQKLQEDARYLVGEFRVAKSAVGDHMLALVEDGLKGVSIGFVNDARGDIRRGDLVTRTRVKRLVEVSMTPAPVHHDAELVGVRSEQLTLPDPDEARLAQARERERMYWHQRKVRW